MKAVLLMAHGAPQDLEEVEEYILRIRHGRPLAPELIETIRARYRKIGGSPLLHRTLRQAEALQIRLREKHNETDRVYVGMRYAHPFISETVDRMLLESVDSLVALCMAPQFSNL
ncbi:MAG TPA: ferrochelatase, partial [Acidobacteriota bacterium]